MILETCATFQNCLTPSYKRIAQRRFQHIHSASRIRTAEMALALHSVFLLCGLLAGVWALPKVTYCPKGWTQLDDSCFIFVNQRRAFVDAERICQLKGGNLASVLDARENALVIELARSSLPALRDFWIGLSDGIQEGTPLWTDGSVVHFTAYGAGQPDDFLGSEDCTEIDDGTEAWNDEGCGDLNYFVCVKEAYEH